MGQARHNEHLPYCDCLVVFSEQALPRSSIGFSGNLETQSNLLMFQEFIYKVLDANSQGNLEGLSKSFEVDTRIGW
jgi:hypothetical protein